MLSLGNAGGYGYYRMNGGALNVGQFAVTGTGGGVPNGVFDLYGGNVSVTANGAWLLWGWTGGNGVVNLFNGTFSAPPGGMEVTMGFEVNRNCFGMLNLLGPNAFLNAATGTTTSRSIDMARNAGNLASVINLNAGVILPTGSGPAPRPRPRISTSTAARCGRTPAQRSGRLSCRG